MDNFTEIILPKKRTQKEKNAILFLWVLSGLLAAVLVFLMFLLMNVGSVLWVMVLLLIVADLYAAHRMTSRFFIEFEYSLTNSFFDVDKIVARSERTSLASLSLNTVTQLGRYQNGQALPHTAHTVRAQADEDSDSLWYLVYEDETGKSVCLVFEPNDRMLRHMSRYISRSVAKTMLDGYRDE